MYDINFNQQMPIVIFKFASFMYSATRHRRIPTFTIDLFIPISPIVTAAKCWIWRN